MNTRHDTNTRDNGTFAAAVENVTDGTWDQCRHQHSTEKAAAGCANWEATAREKGQSRWNAPPSAPRVRITHQPVQTADGETVAASHEFVPDKDLVRLFETALNNTFKRGKAPANFLLFGPSGSGKTAFASYMAASAGMPLTKVDAASMVDPESWFGTREVVEENGTSVTKYVPSSFVKSIEQPGFTFIDEMNRARDEDRNVLLPLMDGTGRVTNPLTGESVIRHPHNFIVMAGNRGMQFTGTSAVDPAFMTRSYVWEFDYIGEADEQRIAIEATGCSAEDAHVFARFAAETRQRARGNADFPPISTREVLKALDMTAGGAPKDLAAKATILNGASNEGGDSSIRAELEAIWTGVRVQKPVAAKLPVETDVNIVGNPGWVCPTHKKNRVIPAGVSNKTGKPYNSFRACPEAFCNETEGRSFPVPQSPVGAGTICSHCNTMNPVGQTVICATCGGSI